jgi:hypothetical protein
MMMAMWAGRIFGTPAGIDFADGIFGLTAFALAPALEKRFPQAEFRPP